MHFDQSLCSTASLLKRGRRSMLVVLRFGRPAGEPGNGIIRVGHQSDLHELRPHLTGHRFQLQNEVQPSKGWFSLYSRPSVDFPLLGAPLISTRRTIVEVWQFTRPRAIELG